MSKFLYSAYISAHNALSNKKIFVIVILSYYFGLLLPFYCMANIEVFAGSMSTIEIIDAGNTYIVNMQALRGDEGSHIENALSVSGLQDFLVTTTFRGYIQVGETSVKVSVTGTGEDMAEYERFELIEGNFAVREGAGASDAVEVSGAEEKSDAEEASGTAECTIAQSLARQYGLHTGNSITLNGITYKIAGIVNNFNYYSTVFIPASHVPVTADVMRHELYLRYGEMTDADQVKSRLMKVFPDRSITSVRLASDIADQTIRDGIARSAAILLVGAVSVLIAVLNTFLVISGKYEENKKPIAIKLALGATRSDIGTELFFENVLFVCLANLLLWITSPILIRSVPIRADFSFSWRIYPVIFGVSVITAVIMSVLLRNKIMKASLAALLKGE